MKWISYLAFLLINITLNTAIAEVPVTLSGPSPAIAGNYNSGDSTTIIYTITNNVPNHSFPLSVSGISSPLNRVTVSNDCGSALPTGPSTCQLGINISPHTQDAGAQINQVLSIDYQGRSPLKSTILFAVNSISSLVPTSLVNVSGTASLGGTATLTATLINTTTSVGISGETVSFTLDGTAVGTAVTNANGVAILSGVATSNPAGTDPGGVVATFAGDSNYLASNGTGNLVVSQTSTTIQNVSGTASFGGTATLTATLINTTTSVGISGEAVSFTLDGTPVGTAVTNANGVAILSGVATSNPAGTDPGDVVATFTGDSNYQAASSSGNLVVSQASTIIQNVSGTASFGGTATLTATLIKYYPVSRYIRRDC